MRLVRIGQESVLMGNAHTVLEPRPGLVRHLISSSLLLLALAAAAGCGGSSASSGTTAAPIVPAPAISSLSPTSAAAGGNAFTLTVNGSNFLASTNLSSGSIVYWNGTGRSTTYVSASQLTASIAAADIVTGGTVSVTVVNPTASGGASAAASFTVTNPVPAITLVSPVSAVVGGAAFTLTVGGTNFVATSVVQWNGVTLPTTFVNPQELTASVPASDLATVGNAAVRVLNAAPGGGTSASVTFPVTSNINPVPSASSLTPASVPVGAAAVTLTVTGSNFVSGSVIQWNGNTRATTYISASQLSTPLSAADLASAQNAAITVVNPAPGGGSSAELPLSITAFAPSITSLSPASVAAGGAAFTLTINGANFLPTSTVQWNGAYGQPPLATTYVSSSQLTVLVPASDIAFAGFSAVNVINPAPGGGPSSAVALPITGSIPSGVSFVATTGSDTNPGTLALPYLTIQKCASTVTSGSTCAIRAGTYRETVTPNSGVTITSFDGEPVTVDGSNPITGWTLYQGSIYKASVALSTGDANQIFVGNQMMTEARWPNGNDLFHVNWATLGAGTTATQVLDPNLPSLALTGAKIHLWSGTDPWDPQTGTITASAPGQLTFTTDGASFPPYIQPQAGGYYFLYRSLALLDAPNEWYYDPTAQVLYLWAPGGVSPGTLNVFAKQRQYAFDLSGKSNVTLENLNLFASAINTSASSTGNTLNGLNAQFLSQFTDLPDVAGYPSSYWYDYIQTSGIVLNGSGNTLENSSLSYSAGNGVSLVGNNNTIRNNLIQYTDYAANYCSAISIDNTSNPIAGGNEVQYNTLHNEARDGIDYLTGTNNDISFNNLFYAMMVSRDSGEIYASQPASAPATGTSIHNNWFHDTQSLINGAADTYPLAGVYLDEDDSGWTVQQNVLWNNQYWSIVVNGSNDGVTAPNNNLVQNNTIPDVGSASFIYTDVTSTCGTTQILNNLVLVPVNQQGLVCPATNNSSSAAGATQMTASVQVGCNFAGCSSAPPPVISGTSVAASIAAPPYNMTVPAGQPVTFTVIAAGSPTLTYQWLRNGAPITGATSASFTIPATAAADNGAIFTVTVSNSVGSATSPPATLTVD